MDMEWIDLVKLLAATIAGALIGLEREIHGKTAGFRTNIMICLGAALFTIMSEKLAARGAVADPGRIAAQIVTGVGFLGAGAIIHLRRTVVGLTTAATIWVVASIGMAFGAGSFMLGIGSTALTGLVLLGLGYAEKGLGQWRTVSWLEVELDPAVDAQELIDRLVRENRIDCRSLKLSKTPGAVEGRMKLIAPKSRLDELYHALLRDEAVRALKRL